MSGQSYGTPGAFRRGIGDAEGWGGVGGLLVCCSKHHLPILFEDLAFHFLAVKNKRRDAHVYICIKVLNNKTK